MNYAVEPMQAEDIPQVIEVERQSFPTMWPSNTYRRELQNARARYLVVLEQLGADAETAPQLVTTSVPPASPLERLILGVRHLISKESSPPVNSRLVDGYLGMWLMLDEAHITTVAVKESHRRLGLGEFLMIAAIDLALELGLEVVTLEVRATNTGAQDLYRKLGFRKVGLRRGYYTDNKEDAIIMSTDNITTSDYQALFRRVKEEHFLHWGDHLPLSLDPACPANED